MSDLTAAAMLLKIATLNSRVTLVAASVSDTGNRNGTMDDVESSRRGLLADVSTRSHSHFNSQSLEPSGDATEVGIYKYLLSVILA
jgi:hypothetical protein